MSNEYCIGPPWTSNDSRNASILFVKTSCLSSRHLGVFFFFPPHEENHRLSSNFLPPRLPATLSELVVKNLHNDGMHDALLGTHAVQYRTDRRDQRCLFAHVTSHPVRACWRTRKVESSAHRFLWWPLKYCVPPLIAVWLLLSCRASGPGDSLQPTQRPREDPESQRTGECAVRVSDPSTSHNS